MGTKASQTMHVEYMVKPIYLASLKSSGILRVLNAYRVHIRIRNMLYTRDIINENVDTRHVSTADSGYGWISVVSGGSITNQAIVPMSWTAVIPAQMGITWPRIRHHYGCIACSHSVTASFGNYLHRWLIGHTGNLDSMLYSRSSFVERRTNFTRWSFMGRGNLMEIMAGWNYEIRFMEFRIRDT